MFKNAAHDLGPKSDINHLIDKTLDIINIAIVLDVVLSDIPRRQSDDLEIFALIAGAHGLVHNLKSELETLFEKLDDASVA